MNTYTDFLKAKADFERSYGQPVSADEVHPILLPHQADVVRWAVEGGRRALFESFGMGKTVQQIEILRLTILNGGGSGLVIAPLGVRGEFIRDGRDKLGVDMKFIRSVKDMTFHGGGLYITNYETVRDGKLDPNIFTAVSLDEAGVLRSFGSKTYQTFLTLFDQVKYKFVATATPSPNRYKELIHYAGFLGVMDTGQALTRWFQRDSTQANNLTLYEHKREEFFMWLNSWSIFLQKPSDLGYSDEGYDLPPLTVNYVEVSVDHSTAGVDRGHLTTDELAGLPVEQRSRLFTEQTLREVYDYESHIKVGEALQGKGALPATFMSLMPGSWAPDVWHDINRMLTLNGDQKRRNVQLHVCPLQLDIVERLITRYTNPGDVVFDPFCGLGTVPLVANRLDRKGRGSELNNGYFLDSVKYLEAEERKREMPTLFDLMALEDAS